MNDSKKIKNLKAQLAQIDDDMPFTDLQPFFSQQTGAQQVQKRSGWTDTRLECFFLLLIVLLWSWLLIIENMCFQLQVSDVLTYSVFVWTATVWAETIRAPVSDWAPLLLGPSSKWTGRVCSEGEGLGSQHVAWMCRVFHHYAGFCPNLVWCLRSILLLGQYMLR